MHSLQSMLREHPMSEDGDKKILYLCMYMYLYIYIFFFIPAHHLQR